MKKLLIVFSIIIVVVIIVGKGINDLYIGGIGEKSEIPFTIEKGEGTSVIARQLKDEGIISSVFLFKLYTKFNNLDTKLIAGTYSLNPKASISSIADSITSGNIKSSRIKFTIVEGWSIYDIANELETRGIAKRKEVMELIGYPTVNYNVTTKLSNPHDFSNDYPSLTAHPDYLSYEGYLFPDTYFITEESTAESIINRIFENFEKKVGGEILKEVNRQGKDLHEVLTLASIIQKEAPVEEMAKVAGVFSNRLRDGIALQSDPTVNYITGKITDRPTHEDIETDSLYNTYKYKGLPPGPIANPGLEAIKAALNPESHSYYYFLNPPGGGKLIYAKTFEEHKRNRELYLQ